MGSTRVTGRTAVVYTLARFAIFFVLTGVLFGLGAAILVVSGHHLDWRQAKPVLLTAAFIAIPLSMLVSWFALARQRAVLAGVVEQRVRSYQQRMAEKTAAEDAYADALLQASGSSGPAEPTEREPSQSHNQPQRGTSGEGTGGLGTAG